MSSPYPPPNPYATPPQQPAPPYQQPNPYGQPAPAYGAPPAYGTPVYGAPPAQAPPAYAAPAYGAPAYGAPADYGQAAYPQPGPNGALACRFCGGVPAVQTTVRGHRGMIIVMQFLRQSGPFCRTCGTAVVRDMSARTLVQGWWGYFSSVFTPITLLRNVFAYNKIKKLPPAMPSPQGRQLDPGKPLTRRPAMLMLLVPLLPVALFVALVVLGAATGGTTTNNSPFNTPVRTPSSLEVAKGDCVHNAGTDDDPTMTVVPCSDPRAQFTVVARVNDATDPDTACSQYPAADKTLTHTGPGDDYVLCLASKNASSS